MKVMRRMEDVDALVTEVVLGVLQRDGVRMLGGDHATAEHARKEIATLEAKLSLTADQFADDAITGEQLRRITQRLRPRLEAQRARLAHAHPDSAMKEFVGPGVAQAWERADIETRKRIIRLLGMRITINRVGPGKARHFDPRSVSITWSTA